MEFIMKKENQFGLLSHRARWNLPGRCFLHFHMQITIKVTLSPSQMSGQELRVRDRMCELYPSGPWSVSLKSSILILCYVPSNELEATLLSWVKKGKKCQFFTSVPMHSLGNLYLLLNHINIKDFQASLSLYRQNIVPRYCCHMGPWPWEWTEWWEIWKLCHMINQKLSIFSLKKSRPKDIVQTIFKNF